MEIATYYSSLTAKAVLDLQGEQESRHIDFKLLSGSEDMSSRDDKKNFARALAGFANSEGGLIVWGVDARQNAAGIDCVVGHPGISNPARLVSSLIRLTPEAVSPGVKGVDHRVIKGRKGVSFVATLVPASDGGPHMARLGQDHYVMRLGASFKNMEPFQIADMFGRRPQPALTIEVVEKEGIREFDLRVENVGRGIAIAPYLLLRPSPPYGVSNYTPGGQINVSIDRSSISGWVGQLGTMQSLIHPGLEVMYSGFTMGHGARRPQTPGTRVSLLYRLGAVGVPEQRGSFEITFSSDFDGTLLHHRIPA